MDSIVLPFLKDENFKIHILANVMWCEVLNVGQATQWAFADGLWVNPKAELKTIGLAILILGQVERPSLCQGTPRAIFDRELGGHCTHDGFYMHQVPLAYSSSNKKRNTPIYFNANYPREMKLVPIIMDYCLL